MALWAAATAPLLGCPMTYNATSEKMALAVFTPETDTKYFLSSASLFFDKMPVTVVATPVLTAGNQETSAPATAPTTAPLRTSPPGSDNVDLCCRGIAGVERRLKRRVGEPNRPDSSGKSIEGVAITISGESRYSALNAASPSRPHTIKMAAAQAIDLILSARPAKGPVPLLDRMTSS